MPSRPQVPRPPGPRGPASETNFDALGRGLRFEGMPMPCPQQGSAVMLLPPAGLVESTPHTFNPDTDTGILPSSKPARGTDPSPPTEQRCAVALPAAAVKRRGRSPSPAPGGQDSVYFFHREVGQSAAIIPFPPWIAHREHDVETALRRSSESLHCRCTLPLAGTVEHGLRGSRMRESPQGRR